MGKWKGDSLKDIKDYIRWSRRAKLHLKEEKLWSENTDKPISAGDKAEDAKTALCTMVGDDFLKEIEEATFAAAGWDLLKTMFVNQMSLQQQEYNAKLSTIKKPDTE
ncbi:hypothetical protein VaNZ11_012185, partial [Volvox africanus]